MAFYKCLLNLVAGVVWKGCEGYPQNISRPDLDGTGVKGLSFYDSRMLYCPYQMLLNKASKPTKPNIKCLC